MSKIAIVETSEGLGRYFTKTMSSDSYELLPVWSTAKLPACDFDSYIITGDYNNISDGLLPIHDQELQFLRSIIMEDKKIFCSCFSHQLISLIYGGKVCKRGHRSFGWQKIDRLGHHPLFKGLDDMYFLCLNGDEVVDKPEFAKVLATNIECKYQVLQYGKNIITFQSHPEIFKAEGLKAIRTHRDILLDRCADLDELVERTIGFANDRLNEIFLENLVDWLMG
jgi:GMP synthase-like glutamine amidotransferase